MTAREEEVRAKSSRRRRWLSLLLFYSPWEKDMFGKLSFRWLNIQITPLPMAPQSPSIISILAVCVRDEVMLHSSSQWWEASFSAPHLQRFIREACLWCARNMKDAGLSASCQLGNYPASLPWAAEPTEPTLAVQRPAALLLMDLINSPERWFVFLQFSQWLHSAGWGHQRPGNKGAALHSKDSTPVCRSQKKKKKILQERKKKVKKRGKHPSVFGSRAAALEQEASGAYFHSLMPSFLFPVPHCGRNNNWKANELLAYTDATGRTIYLPVYRWWRLYWMWLSFKRTDVHTSKWIS